ncbi:unnamed protein product [Anisakis simplex]|uniref:BTB domain-containing protein n=1 Tax=Anisakis simplex TaxID=6269 RepID=A0A0M3K315_ANISI|nr:unnamed protein product [Anisakis simplex]
MSDNHPQLHGDASFLPLQSGGSSTHSLAGSSKLPAAGANGEIQHVIYLAENIGVLCNSADCSDVTLKVEGVAFPAHRVILAARSEYFRALLFNGMRESRNSEIELVDTPVNGFKMLLKYIYTGKLSLSSLKEDLVLDMLGLAHKYGFSELELSISEYLKAILNIRNMCTIYEAANLYSLRSLSDVCLNFADKHASEVLATQGFLQLSASAVELMIQRDSLCAPEIEIFKAIREWVRQHPEQSSRTVYSVISDVLLFQFGRPFIINHIRLLLWDRDQRSYHYYVEVSPVSMDKEDWVRFYCTNAIFFAHKAVINFRFVRIVGTHNSVNSSFHLVNMEAMYSTEPFNVDPTTTLLVPTANVATISNNATVIEGVSRSRNALLNGETSNYDWDNGYTCHQLGSGAIVVQLPQPYLIDSMRLLLWDCDDRHYSYYVEVSCDQVSWTRVADRTQNQCKAWQILRFERLPVVFIRIVGTHNSANEVFHCVHFECPAQRASHSPFDIVSTSSSSSTNAPSTSSVAPSQAMLANIQENNDDRANDLANAEVNEMDAGDNQNVGDNRNNSN